jgi:hypothetical protein
MWLALWYRLEHLKENMPMLQDILPRTSFYLKKHSSVIDISDSYGVKMSMLLF